MNQKIERGTKCKVINTCRTYSTCPEFWIGYFQEWVIGDSKYTWEAGYGIVLHEDGICHIHKMCDIEFNV